MEAIEAGTALAKQLRMDRKAAHLTQPQVAVILGVKQQQISKYERGENRPSPSALKKLARLFGKDPLNYFSDALVGGSVAQGFAEDNGRGYDPQIESGAAADTLAVFEACLASLRALDARHCVFALRYLEELRRLQLRGAVG